VGLWFDMPELIQVERFRQFIVQHLPWESVIENILFSHDAKSLFPKDYNLSLDTIPKLVVQKKVQQVQRYGKYLWLELPPSVYILFHFGMTGSLVYKKATDKSLEFASDGKQHYKSLIQDWPSPYAKLRLVFADGTELAFLETRKLGKLMVTEQHPMQLPFISCLGFDPILSHPSVDDLLDKFQRPHSAVKTVLLNGTVIAGIGNWMADEVSRINVVFVERHIYIYICMYVCIMNGIDSIQVQDSSIRIILQPASDEY